MSLCKLQFFITFNITIYDILLLIVIIVFWLYKDISSLKLRRDMPHLTVTLFYMCQRIKWGMLMAVWIQSGSTGVKDAVTQCWNLLGGCSYSVDLSPSTSASHQPSANEFCKKADDVLTPGSLPPVWQTHQRWLASDFSLAHPDVTSICEIIQHCRFFSSFTSSSPLVAHEK